MIAAVIGCATLILMAAPTSAGGGSLLLPDQEYYEPGDLVVATAEVWWRDGLGAPDDGPYGVWIIDADERWSDTDTRATVIERSRYVADLQISPRQVIDGSVAWAADVRVVFEAPDLPPGDYYLWNCNYPCTTYFGDLNRGNFRVGPPPPPPPLPDPVPPSTPVLAPAAADVTTLPPADEDVRAAAARPPASSSDEGGTDTILLVAIGLVGAVLAVGTWRVVVRRPARTR